MVKINIIIYPHKEGGGTKCLTVP